MSRYESYRISIEWNEKSYKYSGQTGYSTGISKCYYEFGTILLLYNIVIKKKYHSIKFTVRNRFDRNDDNSRFYRNVDPNKTLNKDF